MGLFLSAPPVPSPPPSSAAGVPFRPSIAVIVGVLTTLFSLTFLLLLYARHCKRGATGYPSGAGGFPSSAAAEHRNSGVGRAVVESLPTFRFCALRGQKDGLECAVCLSRFEPAEVLRLLPKCRHAFHVECVDVWLDAHSTCPLCRVRVHPEDILLIPEPKPDPEPEPDLPRLPRRFSGRHSSAGEKSSGNSLQIVIHRVDSAGSADRPGKGKIRKDGLLMTESKEEREQFERRYSHRIVLEDGEATRDRWSDLRPSDLLFLRSEMLMTDSGRFSASRVSRASGLEPAGAVQRAASEITGVSRFAPRAIEEERTRKKWLGLAAQRSARWLGSRESRNDGSG